jgi:hypothetical protein
MKEKIFIMFFVILSIILIKLFSGCHEVLGPNSNVVFPDSLVSYISNVEPFMITKCSYNGCHCEPPYNSATPMTTYFELIGPDNLGLIVPYNPSQSIMIQIIEGKLPHSPPFQQGYFTQNQINGMIKWIQEGAKNN